MIEDQNTIRFKLDGTLVGASISVLKEQCMKYKNNKRKTVLLDFSGISYLDANGVKMLESVKDENLQIINCPLFIEALLKDLVSTNKGD